MLQFVLATSRFHCNNLHPNPLNSPIVPTAANPPANEPSAHERIQTPPVRSHNVQEYSPIRGHVKCCQCESVSNYQYSTANSSSCITCQQLNRPPQRSPLPRRPRVRKVAVNVVANYSKGFHISSLLILTIIPHPAITRRSSKLRCCVSAG